MAKREIGGEIALPLAPDQKDIAKKKRVLDYAEACGNVN